MTDSKFCYRTLDFRSFDFSIVVCVACAWVSFHWFLFWVFHSHLWLCSSPLQSVYLDIQFHLQVFWPICVGCCQYCLFATIILCIWVLVYCSLPWAQCIILLFKSNLPVVTRTLTLVPWLFTEVHSTTDPDSTSIRVLLVVVFVHCYWHILGMCQVD